MEIIDAQLHANLIFPRRDGADYGDSVEAAVAVMDAVGVNAAVVDEWLGADQDGNHLPGERAENGAWRVLHPFASEAVRKHPERFAILGRVDVKDPDLETAMATLQKTQGKYGIRVTKKGSDRARVENGEYDVLFALAEKYDVPIFIGLGDKPEVLAPYLEKHGKLRLALDHMAVRLPGNDDPMPDRYSQFDRLISLSRLPNLYLKWCHIERLSVEGYPFDDVVPHLRRVLDAFGPQRIMWAADMTQSRRAQMSAHPCSYAQTLHYILDSKVFSADEKEWILGKTIRSFLKWEKR